MAYDPTQPSVPGYNYPSGSLDSDDSSTKTTEQLVKEKGLNNLKTYKKEEDQSSALADKYKGLIDVRVKYGDDYIDISKGLPSLEEMFTDDLAYEFYKDLVSSDKGIEAQDKEVLDAIFYSQNPSTRLGYNTDNTFTLEFTGNFDDMANKRLLNKVDGDTYSFSLDALEDGDGSFTINGTAYEGFQDYCKKNNLNTSELSVRMVGVQCPEIPHMEIQPIKDSEVETMTISEARKKGALYMKYMYYNNTATPRADDSIAKFYKVDGKYVEILDDDASEYINSTDKNNLSSDYKYKVVLTKDDSTADTLADGYKTQQALCDLLKNSKKVILKLDANATKANKTTGQYKTYYNHWWHVGDAVSAMIDQWHAAANNGIPLSRLSFDPFGTDGYGRFFGEIYVLTEMNGKEVWVNANKYVLCQSDSVIANPDFSSSPELGAVYGDISNSFELWDYDRNNTLYLDSFNQQTENNYKKRIELHKEITGIDFTVFRNCTLLLGDTLFLIPPTSIRNVSSVEYEKVNILRGRGSMVKGLNNKEQYLEIDLYFYDDYGINGIPYDYTFPNGKKMTYYMDGLRSLVAQFHVAPYLPIENQYINDVLGIETVSLVNLNVRTVEGFPRLLQATLTLRDFNYRIFMPDVPIDYENKDLSEISEMNPVFAKCIHWEVFRYYYQRAISRGEVLFDYEYGTEEYFTELYNNKVAFQATGFCDYSDEVSFYVPDENWLKTALEIKKERDYYGQSPIDIELSDRAEEILRGLGSVAPSLTLDQKAVSDIKKNCVIGNFGINMNYSNKDIFNSSILKTMLNSTNKDVKELDYAHKLVDPLINNVEKSGILTYKQTDESYNKDDQSLTYDVVFKLNHNGLSSDDLMSMKEVLKDLTGGQNIDKILDNNELRISIKMKAGANGEITSIENPVSEMKIIESLAQQYNTATNPNPGESTSTPSIDTSGIFTNNGVSDSVFNGYKKITVDGGDLSGERQPNVVVDIGYGDREYWGFTNEYGQLVKVIAKKIILQDESKEPVGSNGRYYPDEAKVPGTEDPNLDEGHVIADSLGGVSNAYNITPQNSTLNQKGAVYKMEGEIRNAGGCTDFVAIITYPNTTTQTPSNYSYTYNLNGQKVDKSFNNDDGSSGYEGDNGTVPNDRNNNMDEYDYRNPAAMKFVPFIERVPLHSLACGMSNHFTEMTLKIMDGSAPQYMGASDVSIELRIITEDALTVSMLNTLPTHAMNIAKAYRRILNCWPMRIKCSYLQMMGVNEVLIDSIQIENMDGYPGVYDIRMRLTSVDRYMRQRETMKQLASNQITTNSASAHISTYFDIENTLASAETYPDLDLPSLHELKELGYKFIKYNNSTNVYPDPDFYMLYGFEYTAQIIKRNIKDVYLNKLLHCEENGYEATIDSNERPFMYMEDHSGQLIATNLTSTKGLEITSMNDVAEYYTKVMNEAAQIEETDLKLQKRKGEDKEFDETVYTTGDALIKATLADVQEGWELKPGWVATMAPLSTNAAIENSENSNIAATVDNEDKSDYYAKAIFDIRKKAIELIDSILAEPINYSGLQTTIEKSAEGDPEDGMTEDSDANPIRTAVVQMFKDNDKGKELLKLLCPYGDTTQINNFNWKKHGDYLDKLEKPKVLNYIQMFLHAAACALSGDEHRTGSNSYEDYGQKQWYSYKPLVPYCLCERSGGAPTQAKNMDEAIASGTQFGMCQIRKEAKAEILKRIEPLSKIDYLGNDKTHKIYKGYQDGFIDPYYNKLKKGDAELDEYVKKICSSAGCNCYAFLRIVLVYLRKQIIDGYLISEIDMIGQDNDTLKKMFSDTDVTWDEFNQAMEDVNFWESFRSGVLDMDNDGVEEGGILTWINPLSWIDGTIRYFENVDRQIDVNEIEDKTDQQLDGELITTILENIDETYAKSYCARFIYPFLEAATQSPSGPDPTTFDLLSNRKYEQLNILSSTLTATSSGLSTELITKFLLITAGSISNIGTDEIDPSTTSNAQKLMNTIAREAFTKLSEDPQAYVLHSFYDMLTNDKRGRLVRAFPTYYVVFIDEGRKIGSWKIFDNFYNMSAISELTVTKSRKIPADTCSFVMSNMYGSYASEYDNTTRQNYTDVYSLRDVFTSIFSPDIYARKEDALARRKKIQDTTVLQPGVRIHIRMGYGANAGRLPTVFNGKITEIDVGDVVTIIGQGDGGELTNPLNALGEVDATNIIEAQQMTTAFKDIRGSMSRGGLSPRTLLTKILTAEHGGLWKTGWRKYSDGRYYGDNPFGIYHFGEKKFNQIFTEGEVVQNLYEVVDGTLMSGTNELFAKATTTEATPILNTTIQDKTFWDLLTMAAYSGVGYIGAIRDFGFRSTVFLGKPNHYYAYSYVKMDGKFIEKRKPFQQYHLYDSYTDIIYNSIKASDKNIKTNAIGVWEGTDVFWGQEQKTCGPMYLDINIYPEYQKSMTVDTGLIASGNGGIDIPFMTHFSEEWNLNAEADKVNKALAKRITGNTLRETLQNMYQGEICVIGDPSVKPYDRFNISDSYEDMVGQMEVEAVVYSMNFNTGFTTTIYPDLIVRMDDPLEASVQSIMGNVAAGFLTSVTARLAIIQKLASVDSKLLRGAAQFIKPLLSKMSKTQAMKLLADSAVGKALGLSSTTTTTGVKGIITKLLGSSGGNPYVIATMIVLAVTVFCLTKNAKSFITNWIRDIQMLDIYPVFKNQRPFIAGINGHKGCVVGYEYTADDAADSMQGMIVDCYNMLDDKWFGIGKVLLSPFIDEKEIQKTMLNWSNTLTHLETDFEDEDTTQREGVIQNALGAISKEHSSRGNMTQMLRTKYRVQSFDTAQGTDPTYLKYRNLGVVVNKNIEPELVEGSENIYTSSLYTNQNILNLYPVEDDPEIKEAIAGSHANKVNFSLAHSKGNKKDNLMFESGSRIIRYFVEENSDSSMSNYQVLDLPMVHEDALMTLKYIINDENLKNKDVVFMSGTRVNDTRSWKNTGFAFELQSNDAGALEKAVENTKNNTKTTINGEEKLLFNYKMTDDTCVVTVYPEASPTANANKNK